MSREIKFRVWNNAQKIWINSHEVAIDCNGNILIYSTQGTETLEWAHDAWNGNKIYTVHQFTGLKDKNDKEIYEGDILERIGNGSFCKIVICWDDQNCRFISKNSFNLHGDGSPISNNIINISDWTYWVVCGNIMENPELIQ